MAKLLAATALVLILASPASALTLDFTFESAAGGGGVGIGTTAELTLPSGGSFGSLTFSVPSFITTSPCCSATLLPGGEVGGLTVPAPESVGPNATSCCIVAHGSSGSWSFSDTPVVGRLISAANFIIDGVLSDQITTGTFHGEGRVVGGTTAQTPEPLTVGFVAVGVLAAGWLRRRR